MSKYGQFCPVAKTLEVVGDRWTLLIIRNMLCGMTHFNDLERGLPGISRPLLARRLRQLQRACVIEKQLVGAGRQTTEYRLTRAGQDLRHVIGSMIVWGEAWACGEPAPDELDAVLLMWLMRVDVRTDRLPQDLLVVQFSFRGKQSESYWLILTPSDVSVCVTDPGYGIDVLVTADLDTYHKVWYGRIPLGQAVRDGGIKIEGTPRLVQDFPNWFWWNTANGLRAAKIAAEMEPATD